MLNAVLARLAVCRAAVPGAVACLVTVLLAAGCSESPRAVSPPASPQLAAADGFDADVFTLGVLIDLSGPESEADRAVLVGIRAYWAGVNARGGIAQLYPIELSVKASDAEAAREIDAGAVSARGAVAVSAGDAAALSEGSAAGAAQGGAGALSAGDPDVGQGAGAVPGEWDIAALAYVRSGIDSANATAGLPLPVVSTASTSNAG